MIAAGRDIDDSRQVHHGNRRGAAVDRDITELADRGVAPTHHGGVHEQRTSVT